jgi:hypothetical protein
MPIASTIFPDLSYTSFKVSGLILRSKIHFELTIIQGDSHGSSFSFLHADLQFSQQHLLKRLSFSPLYIFVAFVKNQMGAAAWIHIWVSYSVPLVFICQCCVIVFYFIFFLLWLCSIV